MQRGEASVAHRDIHEELAQLVRRAQAGDTEAFAELYRRTAQAQYFTLVGHVGEEAAADLLQEVYEIAWKKIGDIRPRAFVAYLNTTSRNLALRHFRAAKAAPKPAASEDELAARVEAAAPREGRSHVADPAEALGTAERSERLARALREDLSDHERDIVLMRFYQDMKVQDIAEELSISRNTVRNVLNQALATLRRKVGMLPVGLPLTALVADAVEQPLAPGVCPRVRSHQSGLDWGTRAVAAVTVLAAVGMMGVAANLASVQPLADDPVPLTEPASETLDRQGPTLESFRIEDGMVALAVHDEAGTGDVQCVGADGTAARAVAIDREGPSAPKSTWWFALDSGTYTVHMTDTEGNESTASITCDIKPIAPAPTNQ